MWKFIVGVGVGYFFAQPVKEGSTLDKAVTSGGRKVGHKIGELITFLMNKVVS